MVATSVIAHVNSMLKLANTGTEMDEYEILFLKTMYMLGLDCCIGICAFTCYKEVCWVIRINMLFSVKAFK